MGTSRDWLGVFLAGGFWGGLMLLFRGLEARSSNIKLSRLLVLLYAFAGLLYGLLVSFQWQAFRWPLVLVTISTLLSMVFVGWRYRRSQQPRPTS